MAPRVSNNKRGAKSSRGQRRLPRTIRPISANELSAIQESAELAKGDLVLPPTRLSTPSPPSPSQSSPCDRIIAHSNQKPLSPGSREALQEFFQWNHPVYVKDPGHTKSCNTRAPAFYDLHMHPDLRLKRVVIDKDLPKRIAQVCDQCFENDHPALDIQLLDNFPTPAYRSEMPTPKIVDEASIPDDYRFTTGHFCSRVAATLAFSLDKWTRDAFFNWTTRPQLIAKHGIADGFLSVTDEEALISKLSPEDQEKIKLLLKHRLKELAIWEFKSLVAGKLEVMGEIENLTSNFPWEICDSVEECSRHTTLGKRTMTGRRTGPDAERQAWQVPSVSSSPSHPCSKRKHEEQPPPSSVSEPGLEEPEKYITTTSTEDRVEPHQPPDEVDGTGTILCSSNRRKARDIIQQTWAEGVRSDATYLIISAGNLEYIGLRDRKTQTLFLSPLLSLHKKMTPNQGKLYTGLSICAFYDAVNRAEQLEAMLTEKLEPSYPPRYRYSYDEDSLAYPCPEGSNLLEKMAKPEKEARLKEIAQSILKNLRATNHVSLRLPAEMAPDHAYKSFQLQGAKARISSGSNELSLRVDAHTHLGGRAWRVSVQYQSQYYPDGMVMKFARTYQEERALQREYNTYRTMYSETPEPQYVIRIYVHGLLMEYGGISLRAHLRHINLAVFQFLSKHSDNLRTTLTTFHKSQYIHGNLVPEHLVVNKSGQVFFVSLGASAKIVEPQYHGPFNHRGLRRSYSLGAIPDVDGYANRRFQEAESRALDGFLTKAPQ